ncbi:MAG: ABC transporter substrate-binding protein [Thiofilum sp.]|uniref:ABC transporter substrate-binding protein n=1 Tax=Thiofilum sp. TaxID=2212733 RepID=UPI0025D08B3C|nr:ABC transporter substrate-binding protein [Thiofilum sp.]MBK8455036.1 ABC transporter substrate-binding protein [Thiofilum sp.]
MVKAYLKGIARLVVIALVLGGSNVLAAITEYPALQGEQQRLLLLSATDKTVLEPLILDFQQLYPNISVIYDERYTVAVYEHFRTQYQAHTSPDVVISSAMDLQVKLVNDGYAATHEQPMPADWPQWASWRQQAFGFTYEPAVIVYNRKLIKPEEVPINRFELINLLRSDPNRFYLKVGTYDIASSGLGYLFASQDAEQASTWGRLTESLSRVQSKLYDQTADMLNALVKGELLIAYNVLGSYLETWIQQHTELAYVLPSDYTLVMSRVAFISKRAPHAEVAHAFMEYLLSLRGQNILAQRSFLSPIHPQVSGKQTFSSLQASAQGPLRLIRLSPALLIYQDRMKKAQFLKDWRVLMQPLHIP